MEVFFRSYGNIKKKNISGRCGESDTNLWMSQGSKPLGLFHILEVSDIGCILVQFSGRNYNIRLEGQSMKHYKMTYKIYRDGY